MSLLLSVLLLAAGPTLAHDLDDSLVDPDFAVPRGKVILHLENELGPFWEIEAMHIAVDGELAYSERWPLNWGIRHQMVRTKHLPGGVQPLRVIAVIQRRGIFGLVGEPQLLFARSETLVSAAYPNLIKVTVEQPQSSWGRPLTGPRLAIIDP